MTKPYKRADALFFLMKRLGFDPVRDIRIIHDLEEICDAEYNSAIDRAYQQIYPNNERSDWTEYAHTMARVASRLTELNK